MGDGENVEQAPTRVRPPESAGLMNLLKMRLFVQHEIISGIARDTGEILAGSKEFQVLTASFASYLCGGKLIDCPRELQSCPKQNEFSLVPQ